MAQPQVAPEENAYRISAELAGQVRLAVQARDQDRLVSLLDPLHPADVADLLEQVDPELRRDAVSLLGGHLDSEVVSELGESLQGELLAQLPPQQLEEVVRDLESDDVVDLVEDLESEQQQAVLNAMDEVDRAVVETLASVSGGLRRQVDAARSREGFRSIGTSEPQLITCVRSPACPNSSTTSS